MSDPTRNKERIEVGDTVEVFLVYHQNANPEFFEGVVLYAPCATGDSWMFRDNGHRDSHPLGIRYVQTFAEIRLLRKVE